MTKEEVTAKAKAENGPQHIPPAPIACTYDFVHMKGPDAEGEEVDWLMVRFFTPLGPIHIFFKKVSGQLFTDAMGQALDALPEESGIVTPPSGLVVAR